jgi:branched-chain amino acid transport system ATP-binding protein
MILDVNHLYTSYGLSQILFDVSLSVEEGECVSLLGRNGVGKTTTLRSISIMGLTPPRQGQILYKGQDITGQPAYRIAQMGLGFVPEDRRIFPDLTVRENLEVACKPPMSAHTTTWTAERVYELFPVLANLNTARADT